MADYRPIIIKNGEIQQLQDGDYLQLGPATGGLKWVDSTKIARGEYTSGLLQFISTSPVTNQQAGVRLQGYNDLGHAVYFDVLSRGSTNTNPDQAYATLSSLGQVFAGLSIGAGSFPTHKLDVYGDGWFQSILLADRMNIGGTTDPGAGNLSVGDGISTTNLVLNAGSGASIGPRIFFSRGGANKWVLGSSSGILGGTNESFLFYDAANGAERMRIAAGVNIGGTTDPGAGYLQAIGITLTRSNSIAPTQLNIWSTDATQPRNWSLLANNLAWGDFGIKQSTAAGGDPYTAGSYRLYFGLSGGVNIGGTTDPGAGNLYVGIQGTSTNKQGINIYGGSGTGGGSLLRFFTNTSICAIGSEMGVTSLGSATKLVFYSDNNTYRFIGLGAGTMTTDASGNIIISSNEKLKENIKPFIRGLKDLLNLQPITYHWTKASGYDTVNEYTGFGSLQTKQHIPEAVSDTLTFSDRPIIAALVNAMREINQRLKQLEYANA